MLCSVSLVQVLNGGGRLSGGVTDKHVDVKIVRRKTASFFPSPSLCDEMTLISDITFDMPRHAASL